MSDTTILTPTLKKILQTMKQDEKVSVKVSPDFYITNDISICEKFKDVLDLSKDVYFDAEMKTLVRVEDLYKDGTTFQKTLQKG